MYLIKNRPARQMNTIQRKAIALQAVNGKDHITKIANVNQVSRNFIYQQKNKAIQGIDDAFAPANDPTVLFYLPVTEQWINGLIVTLALQGKSSYRGIQSVLEDNLDYHVSIGSIHHLISETEPVANTFNQSQDLSQVMLGAHDEMFVQDKPILVGIDIPSLYCYLLSLERKRDGITWAIKLFDLQRQGFEPERVIADDGDGLRKGHAIVLEDIPCDYDNFHISRDMMDLRRFFNNKLRSATTEYLEFAAKTKDGVNEETRNKYQALLPAADAEVKFLHYISSIIKTLISWMEYDVFNKAGAKLKERRVLFDFIMEEFSKLAEIHPHRILPLYTKLSNQKEGLLAFVDVLDFKFYDIAKKHQCSIDFIWEVCKLQRCEYYGDAYHFRVQSLLDEVGEELFELIEEDVLMALDSTERTSSMVENLNGRVKTFLRNRKRCDQKFLNLLRFYLNHTAFRRSARETRVNKTPAEILTGKPHPHWLEMLGYTRFRRAA